MRNSIRLLTVRGIDIRVHITFPLILVWNELYSLVSSQPDIIASIRAT